MRLLITRPTKQAEATASRLISLGHEVLVEPLLEIQTLDAQMPDGPFGGILLTSSNAAIAMDSISHTDGLKGLPVLTTGQATADAAVTAGFKQVESACGSALELVKAVPAWMDQNGVDHQSGILYPCAKETAHDLQHLLGEAGLSCHQWPVYRSTPRSIFSVKAHSALKSGKIDGILFYSPRTAKTFSSLFEKLPAQTPVPACFAISNAVKDALVPGLQLKTSVAEQPDEQAVFRLLTD